MLALLRVIVLRLRLRAAKVQSQEPVDHKVRIPPDRGCEMSIEFECEPIVPDIVRAVASLRHRSQRQQLDSRYRRRIRGRCHQFVQRLCNLVSFPYGAHTETKVSGELAESAELFEIGFIVDAVDKGLRAPQSFPAHLPAGSDKLSHRAVCKEHELLDKPVSLTGELLLYPYGLSRLIDNDLHFRTVEIHGPCGKSFLPELERKTVQHQQGIHNLNRNDPALRAFAKPAG